MAIEHSDKSLEHKERAYIAASRRTDRSIDARLQSARMASDIHKQRTGKALIISEAIIINEDMYEEQDSSTSWTNMLQMPDATTLQSPAAAKRPGWDTQIDRLFSEAFPNLEAQARRLSETVLPLTDMAHPSMDARPPLPQQSAQHLQSPSANAALLPTPPHIGDPTTLIDPELPNMASQQLYQTPGPGGVTNGDTLGLLPTPSADADIDIVPIPPLSMDCDVNVTAPTCVDPAFLETLPGNSTCPSQFDIAAGPFHGAAEDLKPVRPVLYKADEMPNLP